MFHSVHLYWRNGYFITLKFCAERSGIRKTEKYLSSRNVKMGKLYKVTCKNRTFGMGTKRYGQNRGSTTG